MLLLRDKLAIDLGNVCNYTEIVLTVSGITRYYRPNYCYTEGKCTQEAIDKHERSGYQESCFRR